MAQPEKKLFNDLLRLLEHHEALLSGLFENHDAKEGRKGKKLEQAALKILADIPSFVGVDMKEYGPYSKGQKAELPYEIAKLLDARDGLPVYLIDQALPFLEDRINHYMAKLGMRRVLVPVDASVGSAVGFVPVSRPLGRRYLGAALDLTQMDIQQLLVVFVPQRRQFCFLSLQEGLHLAIFLYLLL